LTREFFVIQGSGFRGNTRKVWGKIKQSMTEKDLSSGVAEVIEHIYYNLYTITTISIEFEKKYFLGHILNGQRFCFFKLIDCNKYLLLYLV